MIATRSHQIREQVVQIPWSIFISKNYLNDISKWPDIKDDDERCHVVRRCGNSKTPVSFMNQLKRLFDLLSWSVSLRYQYVARTSQIGLLYLLTSETWQKDELAYQLRRHDDVSAWSGTSKLVTKMAQFLWVLCSKLPRRLSWFSIFKVPACMLLQRLKYVGII